MNENNLIIIKLGGSVVTFKEKPLTPNYEAIEKIVEILRELKKKYTIIVVHGGGSFGHYWSVEYDMHTMPFQYSDEGVAIVHESMLKLNHIIIDKFISGKLKPYSIQPSNFAFNNSINIERILGMIDLTTDNDIIPVTFGDVIHSGGNKFSILSGDTIMSMLCTRLHPKFSIFTTNVDGLYSNIEKKNVIREIKINKENNEFILSNEGTPIEFSDLPFDVTGGMTRKMNESVQIAKSGSDVYLINGFHPKRILDIVQNRNYIGTCIRMRSEDQVNS